MRPLAQPNPTPYEGGVSKFEPRFSPPPPLLSPPPPLRDFVPWNLTLSSPSPTEIASDRRRQCAAEGQASATTSHSPGVLAFLAMLTRSPMQAHSFAAAHCSFVRCKSAAAVMYQSLGSPTVSIQANFSASLAADSIALAELSDCSCCATCGSLDSSTALACSPGDFCSI